MQFNDQTEYVAGADHCAAYAHKLQVTVEDKPVTREHVDMPLAFAKYHMVSTDVQRYLGFITANDYPALEDLEATISYQDFFPSSYDVHKNEPNSASRTISYTVPFTNITDSTVTIGGNYVFANDINSFIDATVTISEKASPTRATNIISKIPNVRIDHIRGHLTTIEFNYLTAGIVDNGVTIDTRWEGVIDVYF